MSHASLLFFHVLSMTVVWGGSFLLAIVLSPAAERVLGETERHRLLGSVLKRFNPILLGCYGLLIMTGAWMVTGVKIESGTEYFARFGGMLGLKLIFVFLSLMISSYQFFGLGVGIVAILEQNMDASDLPRRFRMLRLTSWINLAVLALTIWFGLALSRL